MSIPTFNPPAGINFRGTGDSIHISSDPKPHISFKYDGNQKVEHKRYTGQTTLGMFDRSFGSAHRLNEVSDLAQRFPNTFKDSGFKW